MRKSFYSTRYGFICVVCLFITLSLQSWIIPTKKSPKVSAEAAATSTTKDSVPTPAALESSFKKLTKDAEVKKGLFTTYFTKSGSLYWEIPDSLMQETFLLSNRIAETSNTQDYVAGQMATRPFMVRFSRVDQTVFLHLVLSGNQVAPGDPIAIAFNRNFFDPILKSFKVVGKNGSNVLIDMSSFFGTNEKCISPLKPDNPLAKLFGGQKSLKGSFVKENSYISSVKSFPKNIEVRSVLSFTTDNDPYTVAVHRSFVLLPKEPMMMRLQDNRVGYFNNDMNLYTSEKDKLHSYMFINRWRLEPKEEDRAKYFAGELVEPAKPIVFYVDNAFPKKWSQAVKEGIESWQTAFEAAGFKNAIRAVDYPTNDPDFDPDDMRYSCIKYAANPVPNAMGPSHIDPRSGEILTADVIWYHNVVSLLHTWRFTQTAAVDPRVRQEVFSDEVMHEAIRYVSAHEVGHTMGLMHNMAGSYSIPVDSLRSPSFTQKYGTTASIMDYARFNFVAQPGDYEKGVRLLPPAMGVYDIYAINWGYRLIADAKTPEQERPILNQWINEKKGDPMYEFGAQQLMGTIDPTAQAEDLGNNHIKASNYGISNLKLIMANFTTWLGQKDETYLPLKEVYEDIVKQYTRHLRHLMPYVGGVRFKEIRQGEKDAVAKSYVPKTEQKQAMQWLVNEARTYKAWMVTPALIKQFELSPDEQDALMLGVVGAVMNSGSLQRIYEGERVDSKANYKLYDYLEDVTAELFKATYKGQSLDRTEIILQAGALMLMTSYSGLKPAAASSKSIAINPESAYLDLINAPLEASLPCELPTMGDSSDTNSFYRLNFGLPTLPSFISAPMMGAQLKKIQTLYKSRVAASTGMTRDFYQYQIQAIDRLFKNN